MQQIVDTHIHVWNFEKAGYPWLDGNTSILNRSYHLHEIEAERKQVGITGGVLVQASNNLDDTDWMLEVAANNAWISGVVGWLPLTDPVAVNDLLKNKYLPNPYFKGIRHLIHDEKDPRWLLQDTVVESLKILAKHELPYDVVGILLEHIETVLEVAEKVPDLRMVFDHLNQPPSPESNEWKRWADLMKTASRNNNFYAKISGLGTTLNKADWNASDLTAAISFALENFGEDRCFCGGDWPVSLLAGSYSKTWNAYKQLINNLLLAQSATKVFSENATKFYKLDQ